MCNKQNYDNVELHFDLDNSNEELINRLSFNSLAKIK